MPTTSAISSSSTASTNSAASSRLPIQTLNQNDFLKLLTTQMSAQDPMNPKSDIDFTAQLAQFSSLEQTQTMARDIASLKSQQQFLQAGSLIGTTVALQSDSNTVLTGVVSGMQLQSGTPMLMVNGRTYDLSQVLSVVTTPTTPTTTP